IRLLQFLGDGRIYACGTYAFDPQCAFLVSVCLCPWVQSVHVTLCVCVCVCMCMFCGTALLCCCVCSCVVVQCVCVCACVNRPSHSDSTGAGGFSGRGPVTSECFGPVPHWKQTEFSVTGEIWFP